MTRRFPFSLQVHPFNTGSKPLERVLLSSELVPDQLNYLSICEDHAGNGALDDRLVQSAYPAARVMPS